MEKFPVPAAPADKPGGGGKTRERGRLGRMISAFKKARQEKTRAKNRRVEYLVQSEKARHAHTEGPELQIPRLHILTNTLATMTIDDERIRELARLLAGSQREHGIGQPKTLTEDEKRELTAEARAYIFSGILQPYHESNPLVNQENVTRHLRTYLEWRWAEELWRKKEPSSKWRVWKRGERENPTASMPQFKVAFREWVAKQHGRKENDLTRPPTLPDTNMVLLLAKRLKTNHMQWSVRAIVPDLS